MKLNVANAPVLCSQLSVLILVNLVTYAMLCGSPRATASWISAEASCYVSAASQSWCVWFHLPAKMRQLSMSKDFFNGGQPKAITPINKSMFLKKMRWSKVMEIRMWFTHHIKTSGKKILMLEPRRLAAKTIANQLASELNKNKDWGHLYYYFNPFEYMFI